MSDQAFRKIIIMASAFGWGCSAFVWGSLALEYAGLLNMVALVVGWIVLGLVGCSFAAAALVGVVFAIGEWLCRLDRRGRP